MPGDEKTIAPHRRANLLEELAHYRIIGSPGPQRKSRQVQAAGKCATAGCSVHGSWRCIFNTVLIRLDFDNLIARDGFGGCRWRSSRWRPGNAFEPRGLPDSPGRGVIWPNRLATARHWTALEYGPWRASIVSPAAFRQDKVLANSGAAWSLRRGHPTGYQHHAAPGFDFADQAEARSDWETICSIRSLRAIAPSPAEFRARRKPLLFVRFVGSFVLRFAVRQFAASLFQLPPRFTRFEPFLIVHHRPL
jgi:hypothetical protein